MLDAQSQLDYLRQQSARDKLAMEQYHSKVNELENRLAQVNLADSSSQKDTQIKVLSGIFYNQDEINSWKQKYESLAKLYAQLRKEHLDLLNKFNR